MISLKKTMVLIFLILSLSSCGKKKNTAVEYEFVEGTKVYAYHLQSQKIEEVYVDFTIKTYTDVFQIYTIYQNYLPLNYESMGCSNVSLLSAKVEENMVYYEVDSFIYLTEDMDIFVSLLDYMNRDLGYDGSKIICNDKIIT